MEETPPKVYDADKGVGVLSGKPPSDVKAGPLRRAPRFYAGETFGGRLRGGAKTHRGSMSKGPGHPMLYPDVERHKNGAVDGIRDKLARRVIRGAYRQAVSSVERRIRFARALKAQAVEVVRDEHAERSEKAQSRMARRLYEAELAIHTPVYCPSKKEIRAMRTEARKRKRRGETDAISKLVDKMAGSR